MVRVQAGECIRVREALLNGRLPWDPVEIPRFLTCA